MPSCPIIESDYILIIVTPTREKSVYHQVQGILANIQAQRHLINSHAISGRKSFVDLMSVFAGTNLPKSPQNFGP